MSDEIHDACIDMLKIVFDPKATSTEKKAAARTIVDAVAPEILVASLPPRRGKVRTVVLLERRSNWRAFFEDAPEKHSGEYLCRLRAIGDLIDSYSDHAGLLLRIGANSDLENLIAAEATP